MSGSLRGPAPGDLLISSVALSDGVFDQAVVLVLDSDEDGALGVILNELSELPLSAVLPEWVDKVCQPQMLFHGGPVSPNGAICLARVINTEEEPPGWRALFSDVGLLHLDTPVEIVTGAYSALRIFAGYAGWAAGQLEAELAQGMWHIADADPDDVFGGEPEGMWRRVLRRQGSDVAWFATWPEDPELN